MRPKNTARENTAWAPIQVLDLFSGCGGLSEGFRQFRVDGKDSPIFQSVGAVEWEPAAAASYAMNFGAISSRERHFEPPEIYCRDIVGWEPKWKPGEIDVVVGGPPCQGFSSLNRNKVRVERNELWLEFIRVVRAVQPKVFVIENVDRFVRSVEFNDLQSRIGSGDLTNYRLVEAPGSNRSDSDDENARRYVLNAADYGAKQARRRAIVIGIRTDVGLPSERMQYPAPTHSRRIIAQHARQPKRAVLSKKIPWQAADAIFDKSATMKLENTEFPLGRVTVIPGVSEKIAGPFLTRELHIARRPEPISLARYRAIPAGGNRKNLRGRYICRFEDGEQIIVEKNGEFRNFENQLIINGNHKIVIDGVVGGDEYSISTTEIYECLESDSARRSKSEIFRVEVTHGSTTRFATIEYLSTKSWDNHDSGSGDVMGRVKSGMPSVTIRTEFFKPEKGRYLHPSKDRPITHYEAAKLQGFPDDFLWCGSKTEIAKQIGNAVPIPLGKRIAESIYRYLRP